MAAGPRYIASTRTAQRTPLPTALLLLLAFLLRLLPSNGRCLQSHYLATALYSCIFRDRCLATDIHATIFLFLYTSFRKVDHLSSSGISKESLLAR
jgi:hypothetical protein